MGENMSEIKAAFFDIDGTLIEKGTHYCAESTKEALQSLQAKGIKTVVCTGRHPDEIAKEGMLNGLSFDGYVYLNGQLGFMDGKKIIENAIDPQDLSKLEMFCKNEPASCILLEEKDYTCNFVDEAMVAGQSYIGASVPKIQLFYDIARRKILQAIVFVDAAQEKRLMQELTKSKSLRWHQTGIDIIAKNSGKERAMQQVCVHLNISLDNCIAFGDGNNDMGMLQTAKIGVAMAGAPEIVKEAADLVTSSPREDGIFKALRKLEII